ncbi:hypothetical protein MMPV_005548 [Pyropia vietnamensis]
MAFSAVAPAGVRWRPAARPTGRHGRPSTVCRGGLAAVAPAGRGPRMQSDAPASSSGSTSATYPQPPLSSAPAGTSPAATPTTASPPPSAAAAADAAAAPVSTGAAARAGEDAHPRGPVPLTDTLSSIAPDVTLNAVIEALSASGSLADALRVAGDARAAGVSVTPRALGALVDAAVGGAGLPALHAVLSAAAAARDAVEYGGWDAASFPPAVGVPVLAPPPSAEVAKKKRRAAASAAAKKKREERAAAAAAAKEAAKAERERERSRRSSSSTPAKADTAEAPSATATAAAAAGAGAVAVARVAGRAAVGLGKAAAASATASAAEAAAAEADAIDAAVAAAAAPPPGAVILPELPDRGRAAELVAGTIFLATTLTALSAEVLEPLLAHHGANDATGFLLLLGGIAAADRYLRGGVASAAVLGGLQRLLAEDPVRETRVEAAFFLAAYALGLPWVCYRPNAVEAVRFFPVLAAGEEAPGGIVVSGLGGEPEDPPQRLTLLDRYLVWLMAGAAAEVAIDGRLIEANIGRGRDVLRRLSGVPGADTDPPVPPDGEARSASAVSAARRAREDVRLRWAVAEATTLLSRHSATYDGLVNKMLDGASAGECAAFVETALRADREAAAAEAAEGGGVVPSF